MLPQKQNCLARNRIGMLCQCRAMSSGRCRFHSPLLAGTAAQPPAARRYGTAVPRSTLPAHPGLLARVLATFAFWPGRGLPVTARRLRQGPAAFALRGSAV